MILLGGAAGAWHKGVVQNLFGLSPQAGGAPQVPTLVDLPEMVTNLNSDLRHPRYVKLKLRLEVPQQDAEKLQHALPQITDAFQTYLREIRPEELQGALGTYRLRQELMARASIEAAPAKVTDVLFAEMLVQ